MLKNHVLSFKELKQRISIEQVLRHYNLFDTLHLRGKSHRGPCPFCEAADGNPFSVSLEKSCYQCFICRASGNILDFVAKWEGASIREASQLLTKNFVGEEEQVPGMSAQRARQPPFVREAAPARMFPRSKDTVHP
jgi:DNA primase